MSNMILTERRVWDRHEEEGSQGVAVLQRGEAGTGAGTATTQLASPRLGLAVWSGGARADQLPAPRLPEREEAVQALAAEDDDDMTEPRRRLPLSYQDAAWRGVIPIDAHINRMGVSFDVGDIPIRLAISPEDAESLIDAFECYLSPRVTSSQSDNSSGSPHSSVSTPDDGESV